MSNKFHFHGQRTALKDPVYQWEIVRQVMTQKGPRRRFDIKKGHGYVLLDPNTKMSTLINMLKA